MRVSHAPPPACQKMTAISAQINADRKKAPALGKRLKHNASFLLLWLLLCTTRHHTKTCPSQPPGSGKKVRPER
jgi:hypothetical protein